MKARRRKGAATISEAKRVRITAKRHANSKHTLKRTSHSRHSKRVRRSWLHRRHQSPGEGAAGVRGESNAREPEAHRNRRRKAPRLDPAEGLGSEELQAG